MAFVPFLKKENIRIHASAKNKEDLLELLARFAAESDLGVSQEVLLRKLREREQTMSTGIGNAVGVPHTMLEGIPELQAFLITLKDPIPFNAVDEKPVCVVIGIFSDPQRPGTSLSALATLGRMLRDERFVRSLWEAGTREDLYRLLEEKEANKGS